MRAWIFAILLLGGCSALHFDLQDPTRDYDYGEWHHEVLWDLVELSPTVDLNDRCEGRSWRSIRFDGTFPQMAAWLITGTFYDPWRVSYECSRP